MLKLFSVYASTASSLRRHTTTRSIQWKPMARATGLKVASSISPQSDGAKRHLCIGTGAMIIRATEKSVRTKARLRPKKGLFRLALSPRSTPPPAACEAPQPASLSQSRVHRDALNQDTGFGEPVFYCLVRAWTRHTISSLQLFAHSHKGLHQVSRTDHKGHSHRIVLRRK